MHIFENLGFIITLVNMKQNNAFFAIWHNKKFVWYMNPENLSMGRESKSEVYFTWRITSVWNWRKNTNIMEICLHEYDDVFKWKHFRVIGHLCGEFTSHRWIPHTKTSDAELWFFSLICAWISGCVNSGEAGDLRHHRAHFDVTVMKIPRLHHRCCK